MNAEIIQADYDILEGIAGRFSQQSEVSQTMHDGLSRSVQALRDGGWEGEGASVFFAEMDGDVFPTVTRLTEALAEAQRVTLQVKDILQTAEEEAARSFGEGEADGMLTDKPSPDAIHTPGLLPDAKGGDAIFSESYMDDMIGKRIKGTGDQGLKDAMRILSRDPSPEQVDVALNEIARARGLSREEVQAHYDRYLDLRAEADRIGKANDKGGWEPLNETLHPNFMGSAVQMRYGQAVGDALGIDPVFGALLNPTGGLVGGGNFPSAQFPDEHAISYHGVFHDAAGYLYNYHNEGPGYDYLHEENRDTSSPLTGQQSGIAHWNDKMEVGIFESTFTNGIGTRLGIIQDGLTFLDNTKNAINQVGNSINDGVNYIKDGFGQFMSQF